MVLYHAEQLFHLVIRVSRLLKEAELGSLVFMSLLVLLDWRQDLREWSVHLTVDNFLI